MASLCFVGDEWKSVNGFLFNSASSHWRKDCSAGYVGLASSESASGRWARWQPKLRARQLGRVLDRLGFGLVCRGNCIYSNRMSAAEIIEQIKRLPPEEKQAVREYLDSEMSESGQVNDPEFLAASDEVFEKYDNLLRKLAQ